MSRTTSFHPRMLAAARRSGGFVLIAALFMLLVLTLMAVSLYRNVAVRQNMTANAKEKGRAFQLAQSTLQYGEYQLLYNLSAFQNSNSCAAAPTGNALTICSGTGVSIANPTSSNPMMLTNGMTYDPSTALNFTYSTTGGANTYYAKPQFFVQFLGIAPDGNGNVYQVTALAYGGTPGAVAVVQSNYERTTGITNLGAP